MFEWSGDRWRHRAIVAAHGGSTIVFESLDGREGTDAAGGAPWPPSPVITDLAAANDAAAHALLAVGAAGRTHFSLSVTRHPTRRDTLLFEVACRVHESPGRLGSTYRRSPPNACLVEVAAGDAGGAGLPRTIRWSYSIGPAGIVTE